MIDILIHAPFLMLITLGILFFIMPSNKKRETRILFGCYFILKAFLNILFIRSLDDCNVNLEYFRGFLDTATTISLYFGIFSLIFPAKKLFVSYLPIIVAMLVLSGIYTITLMSYSPAEQAEIVKILWKQNNPDPRFPAIFYAKSTMGLFALAVILYFQLIIVVFGINFRKFIRNSYSYTEQINLNFFLYLEIFLLLSIILDITLIDFASKLVIVVYVSYIAIFTFSVYYLIANDKVLKNDLFAEQFITYMEYAGNTLSFLRLPISKKTIAYAPEEKIDPLRDKLIQYFREKKPYISKKLTISDIAKPLNSNRTYISQLINSNFDTTFFHFVNVFRIEEAKKQLEETPNYSMKTIAENCGFSSYTTFIKYYKMYKELTTDWYKEATVSHSTSNNTPPKGKKSK